MIGKLIVHRPTRDEAIAALKRALNEFHIDPIKTTIPLQLQIMDNEQFVVAKSTRASSSACCWRNNVLDRRPVLVRSCE
jgi:biotin carboxylase